MNFQWHIGLLPAVLIIGAIIYAVYYTRDWERLPSRMFEIIDDALVIPNSKGGRVFIHREDVSKAEFYKRGQITVDLICCDLFVEADDQTRIWFLHEDEPGWPVLLQWLEGFPDFLTKWEAQVVQPPFAENRTVVVKRTQ